MTKDLTSLLLRLSFGGIFNLESVQVTKIFTNVEAGNRQSMLSSVELCFVCLFFYLYTHVHFTCSEFWESDKSSQNIPKIKIFPISSHNTIAISIHSLLRKLRRQYHKMYCKKRMRLLFMPVI